MIIITMLNLVYNMYEIKSYLIYVLGLGDSTMLLSKWSTIVIVILQFTIVLVCILSL